jgi:TonB family protein
LKKNQWAIQDCASRLGGAGFAGRMVVEWEILETGGVANAKISDSNIRNPPFEAGILSSVRRLKFPAPYGGTVITTHPFVFQQ